MQLDSSDIWLKIAFENCICHRLGQKMLPRPLRLPRVTRRIKDLYWIFASNGTVLFSWTESRKRLWWWCNWIRPIFGWKLHLKIAFATGWDRRCWYVRWDCPQWGGRIKAMFASILRRWNALFGEFRKVVNFNTMRQRFMLHMCCRKWTPFPFDTRPKEKMLPRPLRWPRVTRRIKNLYWIFASNGTVLFSWTESRKRLWWWCNWIRPIFGWKLHLKIAFATGWDRRCWYVRWDCPQWGGRSKAMFASILIRWNAISLWEFGKFLSVILRFQSFCKGICIKKQIVVHIWPASP